MTQDFQKLCLVATLDEADPGVLVDQVESGPQDVVRAIELDPTWFRAWR